MKKLTKQSLDEMARTMSVIPEWELNNVVGGVVPYGTTNYGSQEAMKNFLSSYVSSSDYVEATFVFYADGTCATYIDPSNTSIKATLTLFQDSKTGSWYFTGGTNSHAVVGWGHTHINSNNSSDTDNMNSNQFPGITAYLFYNGSFQSY